MSNLSDKIVILGDSSSGVDATKSAKICKIIADIYPKYIIGVGDNEYNTINTPKYLCNGIDRWSITNRLFAAPGNHDNDQNDNRASFNSFFGGGGYKKVSVGNIDIFIFDVYLNDAEDGYLTSIEVRDRTLNQFQSSNQGQWLINQLNSSTARYKIVAFHQNCWTSGKDASVYHCDGMRWDWASWGVNIIFNAHQHFYERLLVNTGSGNVNVICIGHSGALAYVGPATGEQLAQSQKIISGNASSSNYDSSCAYGFINTIEENGDQLIFKTYGINSSYIVSTSKDELVIQE